MATLRELAERTGYSAATISRILSGDPALSVSMEARRKVLEAAELYRHTEPQGPGAQGGAPGGDRRDAHAGPAAGGPLLPLPQWVCPPGMPGSEVYCGAFREPGRGIPDSGGRGSGWDHCHWKVSVWTDRSLRVHLPSDRIFKLFPAGESI